MPLLEVIPSARTAAQVVSTAVGFGRRMGKTAIVVKDSPGFWINRILTPYMNEAGHLLVEGVAIEEIDRLMVEFGFPSAHHAAGRGRDGRGREGGGRDARGVR